MDGCHALVVTVSWIPTYIISIKKLLMLSKCLIHMVDGWKMKDDAVDCNLQTPNLHDRFAIFSRKEGKKIRWLRSNKTAVRYVLPVVMIQIRVMDNTNSFVHQNDSCGQR
mmetsp:Transcript_21185/g.58914  ORF Transcript_21185/g.58914 Transcript_21185/m.58914 type:complete len:110 (-) Transcript_21185:73-402(-)